MGRNIAVNVAVVAVGVALAAPVAHAQQGISPRQGEGLVAELARRGVPPQEAREGLEALAAAVPTASGRVSRLPSGLTLRVIVESSRLAGFQGCRVGSINFVQGTANASYSAVWCPRPDGLEAQQGSSAGNVSVQQAQAPTSPPTGGGPRGIHQRQVDDLLTDMVRRGVSLPDANAAIAALNGDLARGANGTRTVQGPSGMPITVEVVQESVPAMADCPTGRVAFADRAWFTATFCARPAGWTIQDGRVSPFGTTAYPVAEQMDEARMMRVRAPLLEQPNPASRNLGNLIENSRVRMTGHLSGMPGWVRIEVLSKVGYTQEANLLPFALEQQARTGKPQPLTPIPPAVAAAPQAVPVPVPRQEARPVMPVPATPQPAQVAQQPVPVPAPVVAAPAPVQQAPAPVVAAPAAPVVPVPAPVVTATPAAPAEPTPQQPTAPVAQAAPPPPLAPAPPARRPVDSSL